MDSTGSFHPLISEDADAKSVLFVFAADTALQRRAIHQEALHRLDAATALGDLLMTTKVEAHSPWSHAPPAGGRHHPHARRTRLALGNGRR